MKATVQIIYSDVLDHWSWEVTVDSHSAWSMEQTYEGAFDHARDKLEDMLEDA